MNRLAAAAIVATLALPGAGEVDHLAREIDAAERDLRRESFVAARAHIDSALKLAARREFPAAEIHARRLLGLWMDSAGDRSGAARELERAGKLARATADRRSEAWVLRDTGVTHWRRAEYDAAAGLARQALAIQEAIGDRAGQGASVDLLARIDLKVGRNGSAETGFTRAIGIRAGAGDFDGEIESRLGRLLVLLERRDYRGSLQEAETVVTRGRERMDRDVEREGLCQSAIVWLFQSAPDAALEALREAREVRPADPAYVARIAHLEANALRTRGDHAGAVRAHDEAIRAYGELGNESEIAWNLARRSRSLAALKRDGEAESSLRQALSIWQRLNDRRAEAYWTYEFGKLLARQGKELEAWNAWEGALHSEHEIDLPYAALVLAEMATIAARRGDCEPAGALAADAVESAERSGTSQMLWTAAYRSALVARRCGRPDDALALLSRSLGVIEDQRLRVVPTDEALVGFLEDKQEVFAETVDLLMELGRVEEALDVAERARARAFLDLLRDRPAQATEPRRERLAPRGAPGFVAVEYFVGPNRSFAWVKAGSGRIRAVTIPTGAQELAAQVLGARDGLRTEMRRLHELLWEPIAAWLPAEPSRLVTVVPHGPLLALPFAILVAADGRYLVERHTLDYAPSLAVSASWSRMDALTAPPSGCLVVTGPQLPDAAAEASAVLAALSGGREDVLTGATATGRAVRELAPGRAVLHFATHAELHDDDPLGSSLLLTDGPLTAREILDLPLHARLVVLSACDTGLGRITGEGVLGLSRSFLEAGAGSVVVSLSKVSDLVASYQMGRFYAELGAGRPPAAALRRAQLDTLSALRNRTLETASGRPLGESPTLWAPFIVIGGSPRS